MSAMAVYPDEASYRRRLEEDARLPSGFRAARASLQFVPDEKPDAGAMRMDMGLLRLDDPCVSFAGVFTKNSVPGWPVVLGRRLMEENAIRGILVNNKVANVRTPGGAETANTLTQALGKLTGDPESYIPSSTGVIGWSLPQTEMKAILPELHDSLSNKSILPVAEAMMTTDAWPKVRSRECGVGRVVGIAKGAGMIEPDMATMLSFICTDVAVPRETARGMLSRAVEESFNRITVDGCGSTSDTVLLLSSGKKPYPGDEAFYESLRDTAISLAEDVVRNGEGTAHVFRVTVKGADNTEIATLLARSVGNSPLIKTAIRGNDPNVGRIIQALGAEAGRRKIALNPDGLAVRLGNEIVYKGGGFRLDPDKEVRLSEYLASGELPVPPLSWPPHERRSELTIDLGGSGPPVSVLASDLSEEYVKINAEYRT